MRAILVLCRLNYNQIIIRQASIISIKVGASLLRISRLSPAQDLPCWRSTVRCGPTNRRRRNRNLHTRRAKMRKSRSVLKYNTMTDVNNRAKRRSQSARAFRTLVRRSKRARRVVSHQKVTSQRPGMRSARKSFALMGAHKG